MLSLPSLDKFPFLPLLLLLPPLPLVEGPLKFAEGPFLPLSLLVLLMVLLLLARLSRLLPPLVSSWPVWFELSLLLFPLLLEFLPVQLLVLLSQLAASNNNDVAAPPLPPPPLVGDKDVDESTPPLDDERGSSVLVGRLLPATPRTARVTTLGAFFCLLFVIFGRHCAWC